jgi:hypothetical protein
LWRVRNTNRFTPKTPMICNTVGSGTLYKLPENQKCEPGLGKKTLVELLAPNANTYIVNAATIMTDFVCLYTYEF